MSQYFLRRNEDYQPLRTAAKVLTKPKNAKLRRLILALRVVSSPTPIYWKKRMPFSCQESFLTVTII